MGNGFATFKRRYSTFRKTTVILFLARLFCAGNSPYTFIGSPSGVQQAKN